MTNKIKILTPQESIKIAAGEVIERPAHILKELIENSLDAQAKNITINIQKSGKFSIKITDDGIGMSPDDAQLCFAHHATSKISSIDDLQTITTFGFRGEALSSIASVSHISLITKTENEKLATNVDLKFGTITAVTQTSFPTGTTITITQLFDNIPARKKFLKTDETERNCIINIFQAFALQRIDVTFKLFDQDILLFNCTATSTLPLRCAQLWDNYLHQNLILLEPEHDLNFTITGAISTPAYQRFGRNQIFTFVNNRWVKNSEIAKGIMKGYDGVLNHQKFPAAFIFITAPADQVDINVHPKKEEVKFLHQVQVQNLVSKSIVNTLTKYTNQRITPTKSYFVPTRITIQNNTTPNVQQPLPKFAFNEMTASAPVNNFNNSFKPLAPKAEIDKQTVQNQQIFEQIPNFSIIGQIKKTYIMLEKEDQLMFIDQHAAHERIIYQRLKNNLQACDCVPLLFPHIIKFATDDIKLLNKYQNIFQHHGIIIDQFSDHEIIVQATPINNNAQQAEMIIRQVLTWLHQNNGEHQEKIIQHLHDQIIIEKACKTAVKAGNILNLEQMTNIIEQLRATENNFCCPHGRPTIWDLTLDTLEKHFKRDYVGSKSILF